MVHGGASECVPIISGVQLGSVLSPLLFILYTSEIFENRLFAHADDSTLLAVVIEMLLLPSLAGTWPGFRSGAITGACY